MASWHSAVSKFAGSYRVLLYDAPGQARGSILFGGAGVSMHEQVEVLHSLVCVKTDELETIRLVGASWGAVIAAIYAASYPDKVNFLLL